MSELNEVIPENTGEVQETRDEAGRFIKGVSGNPDGKPKGAKNKFSFVRYWQERWEEDPEEFKQLATEFMKDDKLRGLIIQMVDGRPQQDVTTDGKALPTPILGLIPNVQSDDSNSQNTEAR